MILIFCHHFERGYFLSQEKLCFKAYEAFEEKVASFFSILFVIKIISLLTETKHLLLKN